MAASNEETRERDHMFPPFSIFAHDLQCTVVPSLAEAPLVCSGATNLPTNHVVCLCTCKLRGFQLFVEFITLEPIRKLCTSN